MMFALVRFVVCKKTERTYDAVDSNNLAEDDAEEVVSSPNQYSCGWELPDQILGGDPRSPDSSSKD